MPSTPPANDFARRQAIWKADDAKQLDQLLADLLREQSTRLFGQRWLEEALDEYVGAEGVPVGDADFMIVTVWILYHYRSEATDGLPFAEWWAERKRLRREPAKARLVQAHVDAPIGLWEVQSIEPAHGSVLRDLLSGDTVFVNDRSSTETLEQWLVLCGYIVRVDGIAFIGGVHLQPLPPSDADSVVEAARKLAGSRRKVVPLEIRNDFQYQAALLNCWRIVVEQVTGPQALPELHNTDGHLLSPQRDEFVLRAPTTEVIERLQSVPHAMSPEREGRSTLLTINRPYRTGDQLPGGTHIGRLVISAKRLRVETNSVERADALRAQVEAAAGDLLTFRLRVSQDLAAELAERAATRPQSATGNSRSKAGPPFTSLDDPACFPPEILAHLSAMGEQEQLRWPDYPLPALDGMTPRAAAKDRRMRPRLVLLLKDIEARQATATQRNPLALDIARLRRVLRV